MSTSEKESIDQAVESKVLDVIKTTDRSLTIFNNYGDNLLHVSAANDCHNIIKEILKTKGISQISQKNDCGWTPLMQAIRNGNIETVKLLLENGPNFDQDTFEGNELVYMDKWYANDISPIGLAAAVGLEMFEIVYNACPAALERAKHNKVSPLCAAILKEDKQLLLRLLELGVDVSEASEYTLMLMRQSRSPEIAKLAENYSVTEDYWTEKWDTMECIEYLEENFQNPKLSSTLDNIDTSDQFEKDNLSGTPNISIIPSVRVIPPSDTKISEKKSEPLRIKIPMSIDQSKSLISPRLNYTREQTFPTSPNLLDFWRREKECEARDFPIEHNICQDIRDDLVDLSDSEVFHNSTFDDNSKKQKYKMKRPPNLNISQNSEACLKCMSEASNSAILSSETPKEPCCKTPSPAMILDIHQKKMAILFDRFGITHFLFIFLTQEVDLDLFLTLNDQDLQEIGIEKKADRIVILSVIGECNRNNM